jgi:hypothetical protein
VLTRAATFYESQLYNNYPPLRTLAKLGVDPAEAARAGVGYCTGEGLREYLLEQTDVTEDEIEGCPLWNRETGLETLAGRITLNDLDFTGASLWLTSILPEEDRDGLTWRPERPHNYGIVGRKPFLFGQYSANSQTPWAIFTDDPRLYIVAACASTPAMLMTQYRQPGEDLRERCLRTAQALAKRRMQTLSIVMHDREAAGMIENLMGEQSRAPELVRHDRDAILRNIAPDSRNLRLLRKETGGGESRKDR